MPARPPRMTTVIWIKGRENAVAIEELQCALKVVHASILHGVSRERVNQTALRLGTAYAIEPVLAVIDTYGYDLVEIVSQKAHRTFVRLGRNRISPWKSPKSK